jgi:hypothetical protein
VKFDTSIFRNTVDKIQVSLKSDKSKGYFACRLLDIFDHIRSDNYIMRLRL